MVSPGTGKKQNDGGDGKTAWQKRWGRQHGRTFREAERNRARGAVIGSRRRLCFHGPGFSSAAVMEKWVLKKSKKSKTHVLVTEI